MTCPSCAAETGPWAVCKVCGAALEAPGLAPGTVVAGRYEVQSRLGVGGMGVVYKARDRLLDEVVALKVLRRDATGSDEMERRFRSEIRLARAVSHRNVCRIHEYGEEGSLRYVSMAFVDGVDLRRLLRERGRFPGEEVAALSGQVAEALEAIHQEGIVHRDLKPGNVMVDARGVARVMDFGIAKQWEDAAAAGLTGTGQLVGTPQYMSPEQIRGEKLDGRSDLYSLGVVVYELATGKAPFRGDTPLAMIFKHVHEPPPLHGPEASVIAAPLLPVLERALAKARESRYATALEMADALAAAGRACAEGSESTRTIAPPPRSMRPPVVTSASGSAVTAAPPPVTASRAGVTGTPVASNTMTGLETTSPPLAIPTVVGAVAGAPVRRRPAWVLALLSASVAAGIAVAVMHQRRTAPATSLPTTMVAAPDRPVAPPPEPSSKGAPASQASPAAAPVVVPRSATAREVPRPASTPRAVADGISGAAAMAGLLAEADGALADHANELAASLYDQVLAIDPANERARAGRARVAEALARGTAAPTPAARFVTGQTRMGAAGAASGPGPAGFEGSAGLPVRRVEQAQSPGGKILFEVSPPSVSPGDRYVVRAYLVNESVSAIDVAQVAVTTALNGRRSGGPVEARVRQLAPGQKGLLLEAQEVWHAETTSWAMTVTVRTTGGESYSNQIQWQ